MPRQRSEERTYIPQQIRWQVLKDCNEVCAHCGAPLRLGTSFTLEHVIPLNKGGSNDAKNFVALCKPCNTAKSDDIVSPSLYYTHLPKQKLHQVQTLFNDYMKTVRYLANDTVFPLDQFDINAEIEIAPNMNARKILHLPTTVHVSKMRQSEILDYIMYYAARLSTEDKELVPLRKEDITTPFYLITHKGKTIATISPYFTKYEHASPMNTEAYPRNTLNIDVFFHPDIKQSAFNIRFYTLIMEQILYIIFRTLRKHASDAIVETMIKTPNSDHLTTSVFQTMFSSKPGNYIIYTMSRGETDKNSPRIYTLGTIMYTGNANDLTWKTQIDPDTGKSYPVLQNMKNLTVNLDSELALSREVRTDPVAHKHPTKSQRKKKNGRKKKS